MKKFCNWWTPFLTSNISDEGRIDVRLTWNQPFPVFQFSSWSRRETLFKRTIHTKHAASHWNHTEQKRKGKKGHTLFCHHMCKTLRTTEKGKMGKGTLRVNTLQYCDETCFSQEKHDIWTQTFSKASHVAAGGFFLIKPTRFTRELSLTCSFYLQQLHILDSLEEKASFEQHSSTLLQSGNWLKTSM